VPAKYPGKKASAGPNAGLPSCNPLGKNPGDVWIIPNVKHNHVEKTDHPCQFPVELAERLVLSLSDPGDTVFDPYMGAGSSMVAAIRHGRRAIGCDIVPEYVDIARQRLERLRDGTLLTRPMHKPVHVPRGGKAAVNRAELPLVA
jgi:adenine-specific DNA-methyltransferase